MNTSLYFRTATLADAPRLVELLNHAYRPAQALPRAWTHESEIIEGERINLNQMQNTIAQEGAVLLVAEQNEKIVGCVHIENQTDCAYIGMLTVDPHIQSQGLGKAILSYAEDYAFNTWGIRTFKMSVVETRDTLIAFYVRRGYKQTGTYMDYPMEANVGVPKSDIRLEYLIKSI